MSDKNKKTLTINPNFGKKISSNYTGDNKKKSFNIEKKKPFRPGGFKKNDFLGKNTKFEGKPSKKNFERKFVEQATKKAFIKKSNDKPQTKSKLKLKSPVDKRDFKLTVSRALNVEEIEIKQEV